MSRILVIAEHDGQHIQQSTARCLNCALQIEAAGADVVVFAAADSPAAAEAAKLDGVKRVLLVAQTGATGSLAAVLAPQIVALAGDYDYILAPSTTFGRDLLPRVAALLGCRTGQRHHGRRRSAQLQAPHLCRQCNRYG